MPKRKAIPDTLPRIHGAALQRVDVGYSHVAAEDDRAKTSEVSATTLRYLESIGAKCNQDTTSSSTRHSGNNTPTDNGARKDIPIVFPMRRGNLNVAISAASSSTSRERIIEEYLRDKHANSAHSSLASMDATWHKLHKAWFGERSTVFPTNAGAIRAVAASMKFAGYRSFDNYASRAKRAHIEAGGVWTQDLELEVKDASRSVNRGKGPPRQSAPLPLDKVFKLKDNPIVARAHGPFDPIRTITLMCFFVIREIEAAFALAKHWNLDYGCKTITWHLPVSKTDPTAVGCYRSWGCVCTSTSSTGSDCPWHVAYEYWNALTTRFGDCNGKLPDDLPLFPDDCGRVVTKAEMVEAIENLADAVGERLHTEAGCKRFGGHTPRVTGAQYWASIGLEVFKIQILARWGSPVILRYVSEAPLQTITVDVQKRASLDKVWSAISELDKALSEDRVNASEEGCVQSRENKIPVQSEQTFESGPSWVINPKSGVWRKPLLFGTHIHPNAWRSKCGWAFGGTLFEISKEGPKKARLCDRCVPASTSDPKEPSTDGSEDD